MSNLWFNIRFGTYHWQWGPDGMSFRGNDYWAKRKVESPEDYTRFGIYCLFGKHFT